MINRETENERKREREREREKEGGEGEGERERRGRGERRERGWGGGVGEGWFGSGLMSSSQVGGRINSVLIVSATAEWCRLSPPLRLELLFLILARRHRRRAPFFAGASNASISRDARRRAEATRTRRSDAPAVARAGEITKWCAVTRVVNAGIGEGLQVMWETLVQLLRLGLRRMSTHAKVHDLRSSDAWSAHDQVDLDDASADQPFHRRGQSGTLSHVQVQQSSAS